MNNEKNKAVLKEVSLGILNSYGQVFFSKNIFFSVVLIVVSFFDVYAGIAGVLAVLFSNLTAFFIGLNKEKIKVGAYGFNSLLVGLGIGIYYRPGFEFYIILLFISILTLFVSVGLEGVLSKYGLPYLSLPFLIGIWVVIIASKGYSALDISERGIYSLNDMYAIGGMTMVKLYEWFNQLALPESIRIYFKSLSAILFQYHLFAGILIAIGLIAYSRIAFLLSLIGFYSAYYFYQFIGADLSELSYSYIGFNYILTGIAIGGFFIVPSRWSVLSVIIITPIVAIVLSTTSFLFSYFGLSVFSLPFNLVVILFIYVLKFRERNFDNPALVNIQQYSPEQHAYGHKNYMRRFGSLPWTAINLPFWGEWKVTQAYDGKHTHKGDWNHAWDFEIIDDENKTFRGSGNKTGDYYCFNKPVTACADGVIEVVENGIDDNTIGDMNLEKNWGNTVVIKHAENFYSQISHLKNKSIKVVAGQEVKQGEVIGFCGNSGRSPIPHIHFQLQETPSIGSKTTSYPVSSYIIKTGKTHSFETSSIPELNQLVSNMASNETLKNAYHFIPGETLKFEVEENGKLRTEKWLVVSDIYNNTFLECQNTKARGWFKQVGDVFYFTHFSGKKNTLLYYFFLSSFKVACAFYPDLQIKDEYPLSIYPDKRILLVQDFCIPFFKFLRADYLLNYSAFDKDSNRIELHATSSFGTDSNKNLDFKLFINENGIRGIDVSGKETVIKAIRK